MLVKNLKFNELHLFCKFIVNSKFILKDYTSDALLISEELSGTMRILPEIPLEQKLKELFKTLVIADAGGKVLLTLEDFSKARVERNNRRYTIIIGEYLYQ